MTPKENTFAGCSRYARAGGAAGGHYEARNPKRLRHGPRGDWFNRLVTNHDGAISKEELGAANAQREAEMFADFDTNHDGLITKDEVRAATAARKAKAEAEAAARFKAADTNGDGLLSKEEVAAGMPRLARGFDRLDTNKDGELGPEELAAGRHHFAGRWKGRGSGFGAGGDKDSASRATLRFPRPHADSLTPTVSACPAGRRQNLRPAFYSAVSAMALAVRARSNGLSASGRQ